MMTVLLFLSLSAFAAEDSKLVKAVHEGSVQEVQVLAKVPQELNWKDESGNDALFYAVSLNEIEKVEALLKAGASTQNKYGEKKESILFEATRLGANEILGVLLKKDPSLLKVQNSENESPVFEAVREDQSKTVQYLVQKGFSISDKNKSGKTPKDYVDPKNKKMVVLFAKLSSSKNKKSK